MHLICNIFLKKSSGDIEKRRIQNPVKRLRWTILVPLQVPSCECYEVFPGRIELRPYN